MKLGEYIRQYRLEHGISSQRFGEMCGLSRAYIYILETGKNPSTGRAPAPTLDTLKRIAEVTNTTVDALLQILDGNDPVLLNARQSYPGYDNTARIVGKFLADRNVPQRELKLEIIKDIVQIDFTDEQLKTFSAFLKTLK